MSSKRIRKKKKRIVILASKYRRGTIGIDELIRRRCFLYPTFYLDIYDGTSIAVLRGDTDEFVCWYGTGR